MKFSRKTTKLFIGGTVSSAVALGTFLVNLPPQIAKAAVIQIAQALSPEEVNLRAKQTIVRIDGASVGSGSIINYSDSVYTVLSNWHVLKNKGDYIVQTIDGRKHRVDSASIKKLPGLDLAILKFTSNQNYQTVEFGDSANLNEGQRIYFAGYPGELRQEDNRYYRFFTVNLVGILPKSTENGYSLIYSGEAFPGMSGSPVFNQKGLMIGVHGEANVHAVSGGTSNYGIPINSYQQAIAQLNAQPPTENTQPATASPNNAEVANQPEVEPTPPTETNTPPKSENTNQNNQSNNQPQTSESLNPNNISSVPTFTPDTPQEKPPTTVEEKPESEPKSEPEPEPEPEVVIESSETPQAESEPEVVVEAPSKTPKAESEPEVVVGSQPEVEETETASKPKKIALVSQRTGIDYTNLRNLLRDKQWSEADLHTYKLVEQIVRTAKQQNKHIFIELKTIAEFSCPDIRTIDYLWKKYSSDKFGFSSQQKVWQSVNNQGDFSTQTWRRFATEVGWKEGEVTNGSGYLLYDELNFEPTEAPAGHLPWWFALPQEKQEVIKHLFARCNFNPSVQELEAEARINNSRQPSDDVSEAKNKEPNIRKAPK